MVDRKAEFLKKLISDELFILRIVNSARRQTVSNLNGAGAQSPTGLMSPNSAGGGSSFQEDSISYKVNQRFGIKLDLPPGFGMRFFS